MAKAKAPKAPKTPKAPKAPKAPDVAFLSGFDISYLKQVEEERSRVSKELAEKELELNNLSILANESRIMAALSKLFYAEDLTWEIQNEEKIVFSSKVNLTKQDKTQLGYYLRNGTTTSPYEYSFTNNANQLARILKCMPKERRMSILLALYEMSKQAAEQNKKEEEREDLRKKYATKLWEKINPNSLYKTNPTHSFPHYIENSVYPHHWSICVLDEDRIKSTIGSSVYSYYVKDEEKAKDILAKIKSLEYKWQTGKNEFKFPTEKEEDEYLNVYKELWGAVKMDHQLFYPLEYLAKTINNNWPPTVTEMIENQIKRLTITNGEE